MIITPAILNILQFSPLFHGIAEEVLRNHLGSSRFAKLPSGKTLLTPNQANNTLYVVLSGRLRIQSRAGDVEPIAIFGEGECVGEMSMLGAQPVSAYVIAANDCELLAIDHAAMWKLIDCEHAAAHNMLNMLTSRIRHTNQIAAENLERAYGYSSESPIDELTGLYNQRTMQTEFTRHLQRSLREEHDCCLLLLEMDGYATFAAQYGQLGSDQALRNIAHTLLSCLRPGDPCARDGEARFAILLPRTNLTNATHAAIRLKSGIGKSLIVLPNGDALPASSVSIGISQTHPSDTLEQLFQRSNQALQLALAEGGDEVKSCA